MRKVYLDNAATTQIHPEVITAMMNVLQNDFGNPSSTHSFGRSAKTLLESSRKSIAKLLNAQASEIIFTSSATEATNWILTSAVKDLGIKPDNTFTPLFSTSRLLFLVEGIDDANAMHHKANLYKQNGLISHTFEELSINIIPIGGCGGVKHWINL